MSLYDRASETGTGRWHVRMLHPAKIVEFADFQASSIGEATAAAEAAYPGYTVEWTVREPDRYGVWRVPQLS